MKAELFDGKWCGSEVSKYGKENGRIDYACLSRLFNLVLNNDIIRNTFDYSPYWKKISGSNNSVDEDEDYVEIYQTYIVDKYGADLLQKCNEIVYYNEDLDMYVWGVTHVGTGWDYVLTDIKIAASH